jgi:hypothetical protein
MSPDLIFAALIAVPALILMLLRVNAALVFLSACLGSVLLQFVGGDAMDFFSMFLPKVSPDYIKLGLILLPVVLTTLFMIKTVKGGGLAFNLLPALGTGLLIALLVVPLFTPGLSNAITGSDAWNQAFKLQSLMVGASALLCLFFLWMQRPKHHKEDKHGKHH